MITFRALKFEPHPLSIRTGGGDKQAVLDFENGYGVSIVFGDRFYSNGVDTYEVAITMHGIITYDTPITDDVMGYLTRKEVDEVLIAVQELETAPKAEVKA